MSRAPAKLSIIPQDSDDAKIQRVLKKQREEDAKPKFSAELEFALELGKDVNFATKNGVLHRWDGVFWEPLDHIDAERFSFDWLANQRPDVATALKATAAVNAATLSIRQVPDAAESDVVTLPCKNGYLQISQTGEIEFVEPSKSLGLTYVLGCQFDEFAAADKFEKFVESVQPDDEVRALLQEYVGYTLLSDTRHQVAQLWLGGGSNGKGTLAQIISKLHEKVVAVNLDSLQGFQLTGLLGASLAYSDETPNRIDEQRIKTLISGDLVQIERKFRDNLSLRPTAKWIVCANAIPSISDHSTGFWRRWHIIPFTQTFSGADVDPMLARDVVRNELPGVLNWAVEGLVRLLQRGRFPIMPDAVLSATEKGKRETNSVLSWVEISDLQIVDPHSYEAKSKSYVYQCYATWCVDNGMSKLGSPRFWARLRQVLDFQEIRGTGQKRERMVGLGSVQFSSGN
ncbi:MAG: phage/plasmid primase, P4 family [Pseudomonadota bacterium]